MTKEEFLLKYSLNNISESSHKYEHTSSLREAAVLIPLIDDGKQLNVLFTKRSLNLRHHGGQISFPGGKIDKSDKSLRETATRETFEEIGVKPEYINIIGKMHNYHVRSGFIVTPYIGFIPNNYHFVEEKSEVSEIFQVPLKFFLESNNHMSVKVERKNNTHHINFVPYNRYNIWGATASMLKDLAIHLN